MDEQTAESGGQDMYGRVALVAGASKGIGAATAEAFAAAGAAVVLGSRDSAALETVADRIRSRGGRALTAYLDVTDADSMRGLVDQALSTFGRLASQLVSGLRRCLLIHDIESY